MQTTVATHLFFINTLWDILILAYVKIIFDTDAACPEWSDVKSAWPEESRAQSHLQGLALSESSSFIPAMRIDEF